MLPAMAATETRLLVLGAVRLFEPVNGYQIRRELLSWGVEEWANIAPGSIYHGLSTLAERGHLVRHDLRGRGLHLLARRPHRAGRPVRVVAGDRPAARPAAAAHRAEHVHALRP